SGLQPSIQNRPEIQGLKPLAIIGRALGPEDEKVFALLRKLFGSLLQINSAPIYIVHPAVPFRAVLLVFSGAFRLR
ncbi:MAG: hypothetical protein ACLFUS_11805, partial [Candidatus Sumerlaeia bacterium]